MTQAMPATDALDGLYEALSPADREAVDVRRGLGEGLGAAFTGAGLLLPPPLDDNVARARHVVATALGVDLLAVEADGCPQTAVIPPSRAAAAVVAAAAGEWARLNGGHLIPADWRALVAATDTDHARMVSARHHARHLILTEPRADVLATVQLPARARYVTSEGTGEA